MMPHRRLAGAARRSRPLTRAGFLLGSRATTRPVWLRALVTVVLVALLAAPPAVLAQGGAPAAGTPLARAVAWLQTQQNQDGGFGSPGKSDPSTTASAVIALAAGQRAGLEVKLDRALAYLDTQALVYTQRGVGQAAELALAERAAGRDPSSVAKVNPLAIVEHGLGHGDQLAAADVFDHALAMLALAADRQPVPAGAVQALARTQIGDGSWAFDGSTEAGKGDSNTTALVIQALVAAGHGKDAMVAQALAYLRSVQAPSGAFAYQPAHPLVPDANSTALAVQAILAAGQDPASPAWKNATAALAAFQNPSGAFRYTDAQRGDNLLATVQAIPALAGLPLPILPRGRATPAASAPRLAA